MCKAGASATKLVMGICEKLELNGEDIDGIVSLCMPTTVIRVLNTLLEEKPTQKLRTELIKKNYPVQPPSGNSQLQQMTSCRL
jgi:hypothetical protein